MKIRRADQISIREGDLLNTGRHMPPNQALQTDERRVSVPAHYKELSRRSRLSVEPLVRQAKLGALEFGHLKIRFLNKT